MKRILFLLFTLSLSLDSLGQKNKISDHKPQISEFLDSLMKSWDRSKELEYDSTKVYRRLNYDVDSDKKRKKIKCKKIDSLNIKLPKKDAKKHSLGLGYGIYTNDNLFKQQKYLADDFFILSYRYLIPLQLTKCENKFIFLNTAQHINFLTFIDKYKKLSYLGTLEVGYQTKSEYLFNYNVALGAANYWHFASNPVYFIDDADGLDSISNHNSTYFTLRLGTTPRKLKLLHLDFLLLFNTQKNSTPKFTMGFNLNLMPYFNFKK